MSFAAAAGIIAGSVLLMVVLMLAVRRIAPPGGHFRDSDRASGVFEFAGAGFAILLGFVVLLSFGRYSDARENAAAEATAVFEQNEIAELFQPPARRNRLLGELVCYGRAVVEQGWPAMEHGRASPGVELWVERMEGEVTRTKVVSRDDETAVTRWFEAASARDNARRQRLLDARGTLPALLWIVLVIAAVSIALFVLLYADPSERALGQIAFAATVTAVMVSSLLAVALLSSPFQGGHGSVGPADMRYTLRLIEEETRFLHHPLTAPCDERGVPRAA
jgi:hypothetical protein